MRSKIRGSRRPLRNEDIPFEPATKQKDSGRNNLNNVVDRISLEKVSYEERRREAKKPLYLVRYE